MTVKPTYEELERRVQELEKIESEHKYSKGALRESESLFKMLYEKAPLGYQSLDENGHFIVVNQPWLDTLGYTREEVIGKSFADFLHPDWRDHFKENFPRFKAIGEILGVEFEMVKKNETLILVSFTGKISRDKKGNFQQTHCIFHDITDRKRAETALRQSEEKFRTLVNTAPFGIQLTDLEGRIIYSNPAHHKMQGYGPHELIGMYIWDLVTNDSHRAKVREYYQTIISKKPEPTVYFNRDRTRDGRKIDIQINWDYCRNEKDEVTGIISIIEDITERKQAENVLREREELLSRSQKLGHIGSWKLDLIENCLTWSDEVYRIFGYEPQEFSANYEAFLNAVHPDDRSAVDEAYSSSLQEGSDGYEIEHRVIQKNSGEVRYVQERCIHERNKAGIIIQSIGMVQDITERKKAEEEKEKLHAQLTQAQKLESVGRLAGGVAHDFNNMLGVILGHLEFALEKTEDNNDLNDDLKEIQKAAQRSADLTKQLLTFARKQIISPRQLDLNDTVESMLNMLHRLIGENIDLVWKPSAHIWPVKMDPSQLDQILANLCVNARDAISGVGKLTIETGRKSFDEVYCRQHSGFIPGDFVLLAVSDNGCGMDKDTLDNLFEPFFTTKEVGKGTGLGLATVYGIIKQNNGFINVYSEPGQGSSFKIYLPRFFVDEDSDKAVSEKKAAAGGTETILLVEDEPSILRMTRMMLERKGYSVLSAASPVEAIEMARNHTDKIHLLMSDVVMPEMNGRDLAGQITALYPGIQLLFMSGYTANVIAHQGVLDSGVAFIQKPFSMADMTEMVRELLDMASDKNQEKSHG